ncbi:S-formylglutathione hydrolase [Nannocystis radixulma]|uniref:S-formylglutathione hydrolase n=1 Tax=Nannocystis radixulma TaxID=2995305 RepID=A0ABT5BK35_9BACT|nr:S-formylglutathione hydrolase [Nannocystis radixulma]MDC0674514.1 S-formylglutathione hydrolase [Nannocystis radixulma]
MALKTISESRCFGGVQGTYSHASTATGTEMRLSVFVPEEGTRRALPVVVYLSGLSCTEENFTVKAGAQRYAAELGLIVVAPDTSPRGPNVADDPAYDLGQGAGFYVDALQSPWAPHFRMYSYVAEELPALIATNFPQRPGALGIMGHSMGGHGALVLGLREQALFGSVSALAPIATPSQVPWGIKAFSAYLGPDAALWRPYDATALIEDGHRRADVLRIDQGEADKFLGEQLRPEVFAAACERAGQPVEVRRHPGYDHGYFFVATVIGDHLRHHAELLARR